MKELDLSETYSEKVQRLNKEGKYLEAIETLLTWIDKIKIAHNIKTTSFCVENSSESVKSKTS